MKSIINYQFFFCFSIFTLLGSACNAQELTWATVVSSSDYEYGVDADIDSQGNMFIIGHGLGPTLNMDSVTNNTNGDGDAFIAKLSSNKQLLWFRTLGGDDNVHHDNGMDIHVDNNDDVIILVKSASNNFTFNGDTLSGINSPGQNSGEGVIIKVDNNGTYLWHDHGSVSSSFQNVVTDSAGNIYLTGWFGNSITLGNSIQLTNLTNGTTLDMFVAKYSSTGILLWAKNAGGVIHNAFAYGHNIAIDESSGKVVILGRFSKSINFNSGTLSTSALSSSFLAAYDTSGVELWVISTFNNGYSYCQGLDISSVGLIGIAGYNTLGSNPDGLIGFYDLSGNVQSEEVYTSDNCRLHSLEFNLLDECFISGVFYNSLSIGAAPYNITLNTNTTNNYKNGLILKLSDNQLPIWANQLSASLENKVTCKDNLIFYSGRIDHPLIYNYGTDTISNNSGDAVFAEISDTSCPVILIPDNQIACDSFTWIDGNTYYASTDTITHYVVAGASNGCDALYSLDLTIKSVSDITTEVNGIVVTANAGSANYQWLDCNDNFALIPNEINQSFTPIMNGNYAVEITENGCIDTSACVQVVSVGIIESNFGSKLTIYPNPTRGNFSIDLGTSYEFVTVNVIDLNGTTTQSKSYTDSQLLKLKLDEPSSIYLLVIESGNKKAVVRMVKE